MRYLITGAAGFIGSHLADRLHLDGHNVGGLDNFQTGRYENWPGCALVDVTDRDAFYSAANAIRPDVVIHCAASYSDPLKWHRDTDTNVAGTINAINVAKHHNARLVYFNTALPPISSYAISKIAGEQYIKISGVEHLIFRLANVYGPRNLSGPVPTFYRRLAAEQTCTVTDTRRDMVFVEDLVELVTDAIRIGATGKYDVCSGIHRPIRELYDAVARSLGEGLQPTEIPAPADDVKQMELNPSRALTDFNWRPRTPLHEGIGAAVAWYREHGVESTYTHLALKG